MKGQDPAIHSIATAIQLSRAGLHAGNRPVASFLLLGKTGTGKTELAKTLAEELTGTERNLITINMSEYSEKHTVSRLIGAAPGYIGFENAGQLTEAVRRKPFSVVLFDEFEKAHPSVSNILLQILDEGTLTDSQGRKVDFKNTIVSMYPILFLSPSASLVSGRKLTASRTSQIILTSNIGSDILSEGGATQADGSVTETTKEAVLARVQSLYQPELINRLDEQIIFNSLSPEAVRDIVTLRIGEVQKTLNHSASAPDRQIALKVEDSAKEWLAKNGYQPQWGARALNRLINKEVRTPLASALLRGTLRNGDEAVIKLNSKGDGLEVVEIHEPELANQESESRQ